MLLGFVLSKEHPALSCFEAESLFERKPCGEPGFVTLTTPSASAKAIRLGKRLAYTRLGVRVLFSCPAKSLDAKMRAFPWKKHCGDSFAVRIIEEGGKPLRPARDYASHIWAALPRPKTDLEAPSTEIYLIFTKKKAYCGVLLWKNAEDFNSRRAHKRPGFLPTSIHPRLARACVNLLGPRCKTVMDPFCGTGGFLIEAGLMGLGVSGSDIDNRSVVLCSENLSHYGITDFNVTAKDALSHASFSSLVTDLPYGKNSLVSQKVDTLYTSFFSLLSRTLRGTAVVMLLSTHPVPKNLKLAAWFDIYVHRSMTKRILVLRRK